MATTFANSEALSSVRAKINSAFSEINSISAEYLPNKGGTLINIAETILATGGATIDASSATWHRCTLTQNETPSFVIASGQSVYVEIDPSTFAVSFNNVTKWAGTGVPSSVGSQHPFVFWSNDGSEIIGNDGGNIS